MIIGNTLHTIGITIGANTIDSTMDSSVDSCEGSVKINNNRTTGGSNIMLRSIPTCC